MIADLVIANLLRIAREDLDGASVLLPHGNRNAAYLCEQAAEKVIRAVLTSEGHHAGIRHQLDEMVNVIPDENPLKPALREIEQLAAYATAYRYPPNKPLQRTGHSASLRQAGWPAAERQIVRRAGREDHPMDTPVEWRDLIERILTEETRVPVSYGEITLYTVFDRTQDHYLLMAVGWEGHKRVHAPLIHVDIIDGKIWIQHDGTERGVARDLEAAGIPKDRIVLAFQHISRRRYGDYAAA